jgi:hypothetical protein
MARIKFYNKETNKWEYADKAINSGKDYVLTDADKAEIAELAAELIDIPTDEHINSLINTALGVIENGTY